MTTSSIVGHCTEEAVEILRWVHDLRSREPKPPIVALSFKQLASAPLLEEGQPEPGAAPSEVYAAAIRFWASAVARQIDSAQLRTVIEEARRRSPGFNGDAVRLLEVAFEGLTLTDGVQVWP